MAGNEWEIAQREIDWRIEGNFGYTYLDCHLCYDMEKAKQVAKEQELMEKERFRRAWARAKNQTQNNEPRDHQYKVGDFILIVASETERQKQPNISSPMKGPYTIVNIHGNGDFEIQRGNFTRKVNASRIKPYTKNA